MPIIEEPFGSCDLQVSSTSFALSSHDVAMEDVSADNAVGHSEAMTTSAVNTSRVAAKPRQTRDRSLRENDWDRMRPLIASLYKVMTLNQLMVVMERFGFRAKSVLKAFCLIQNS